MRNRGSRRSSVASPRGWPVSASVRPVPFFVGGQDSFFGSSTASVTEAVASALRAGSAPSSVGRRRSSVLAGHADEDRATATDRTLEVRWWEPLSQVTNEFPFG
ncbi:MAG: hypothetical protein KatS3mg111_1457 [Pirellulaceae bacterium]|nr:MAG: hypothetical protein KatS3mg111_1457 [Pirellulaceae bacterium]